MGMKSSVVKNLNAALIMSWKDDEVGTPWEAGDTIAAVHNSIIFIDFSEDEDRITINLPEITPASAGKSIFVRNMLSKFSIPGQVELVAYEDEDEDNTIEGAHPSSFHAFTTAEQTLNGSVHIAANTYAVPVPAPNGVHFQLESDGNGRWSFLIPNSGWWHVLADFATEPEPD